MVYKHSPFCRLSSWARREVQRLATEHPATQVFVGDVIQNRRVSDAVGERFGIRHESPQAFVVRDGKASWTASHGRIRAAALKQQIVRTPE